MNAVMAVEWPITFEFSEDSRYNTLLQISVGQEEVDEVIGRDINRTFPEHPQFGFEQGQSPVSGAKSLLPARLGSRLLSGMHQASNGIVWLCAGVLCVGCMYRSKCQRAMTTGPVYVVKSILAARLVGYMLLGKLQ